jgi:predicted HAD superfamily Cof-like phosphohydrolase
VFVSTVLESVGCSIARKIKSTSFTTSARFKMDNSGIIDSVKEFHKTFGHPVIDKPAIPSSDRCKLRVSLIREELEEFEKAIENNDLVEVADALCDLQYVLAGAILEFGLGNKFLPLFREVQRSNMSKACNSIREADDTIKFYKEQHNIDCIFKEVSNKFLVYRLSDNKIMKSIYYSPANLSSLL